MDKKELMQCFKLRKELKDIEIRIKRLTADAHNLKSVRYNNEPKHKGEAIPAAQQYVESQEELAGLYDEQKCKLMKRIIRTERTICKLDNSGERCLIRYRYVDGLHWDAVNEKMHISESTSKRMHREALKKLSKM